MSIMLSLSIVSNSFLLSCEKVYLILFFFVALDLDFQEMKKHYEEANLEEFGKQIFDGSNGNFLVFFYRDQYLY